MLTYFVLYVYSFVHLLIRGDPTVYMSPYCTQKDTCVHALQLPKSKTRPTHSEHAPPSGSLPGQ